MDFSRVEQSEYSFVGLVFLNQVRNGLEYELAANDFVSVNVANLLN